MLSGRLPNNPVQLTGKEGDRLMQSVEAINERQVEMLERLVAIETLLNQISDHLRTLNGKTDKTVDRVVALEKHPGSCEARMAVAQLMASKLTEERIASRWEQRLKPIMWMVLIFGIGVMLGHSELILKLLGAK